MKQSIQIISSTNIDITKWNHCIQYAPYPRIYAEYEYLSTICENWSGLIIGNYDAVMPLPWKSKLGFRYLYAPAFIQQLGIFGNVQDIKLTLILEKILAFAKYGDIFFNYQNIHLFEELSYTSKKNFVLDLNKTYPDIASNYSQDLKKNLLKSNAYNFKYSNKMTISEIIALFKDLYQKRLPQIKQRDFKHLENLCTNLLEKKKCFIRTISNEGEKTILAAALMLKDKKAIYLLLNAVTNDGRKISANHFLIDQIIQEFVEEEILFDFEGSETKGIKDFYESFHPLNHAYYQYHFNNLPFPLKFAKNILTYFRS